MLLAQTFWSGDKISISIIDYFRYIYCLYLINKILKTETEPGPSGYKSKHVSLTNDPNCLRRGSSSPPSWSTSTRLLFTILPLTSSLPGRTSQLRCLENGIYKEIHSVCYFHTLWVQYANVFYRNFKKSQWWCYFLREASLDTFECLTHDKGHVCAVKGSFKDSFTKVAKDIACLACIHEIELCEGD